MTKETKYLYLWQIKHKKNMYATISADIVSSTSLSKSETIKLKKKIKELFMCLEEKYPKFWGRQIKGDYIECLIPNASDAFRIALLLKSLIKSFHVKDNKRTKDFQTYGLRIAIGIGDMRIINKTQDILDGEAIYLSGRALENMGALYKGTLNIETVNDQLTAPLRAIALLTDAVMNNTTLRQSEVIYHKLLSEKELEIAEAMGIKQSSVNGHATAAKWYCIEEALAYFEHLNFENNGC